MFFALSKIFWLVAAPSNLLGILAVAGVIALRTRYARWGYRLVVLAAAGLVLLGNGPAGTWLIQPLEERFPRPAASLAAPDGIIVLGGGMDEIASGARNALVLGSYGSRMTETVALSRRFPQARILFTGGDSNLIDHGATEAEIARRFFDAMGVDAERITYEDKSRNTWENAILSRELVRPRRNQRWLLVTSGFHMPRAMGAFRRAGFDVTAWPADYMTDGSDLMRPNGQASNGLRIVDLAVREWIGILAYHLTGKTDAWLPAP